MNNITEKNLRLDVHNKEKQILDLYALVDTLQTNLASTVTYLNEEDKKKIVSVPTISIALGEHQVDFIDCNS